MFHVHQIKTKQFGIVYDELMMGHKSQDNHPEKPDRIKAIYDAIDFSHLRIPSRKITRKELEMCHEKKFLDMITNQMKNQSLYTGDMYTSPGTLEAAELAAGCSIALAEALFQDRILNGYAIVRPPGHHAKCGAAGGFCFYNNAMLAASYLLHKGKKVYIVDWDLHFGDGTVNILNSPKFRENLNIGYFSIHRYDNGTFYPGVGKTHVNASLSTGSFTKPEDKIVLIGYNGQKDDEYYIDCFKKYFLPHVKRLEPDFIIVSAGFDAHHLDPMEGSLVTTAGYRAMMEIVKSVTPRIGMILEGGYSLPALRSSSLVCMNILRE